MFTRIFSASLLLILSLGCIAQGQEQEKVWIIRYKLAHGQEWDEAYPSQAAAIASAQRQREGCIELGWEFSGEVMAVSQADVLDGKPQIPTKGKFYPKDDPAAVYCIKKERDRLEQEKKDADQENKKLQEQLIDLNAVSEAIERELINLKSYPESTPQSEIDKSNARIADLKNAYLQKYDDLAGKLIRFKNRTANLGRYSKRLASAEVRLSRGDFFEPPVVSYRPKPSAPSTSSYSSKKPANSYKRPVAPQPSSLVGTTWTCYMYGDSSQRFTYRFYSGGAGRFQYGSRSLNLRWSQRGNQISIQTIEGNWHQGTINNSAMTTYRNGHVQWKMYRQ